MNIFRCPGCGRRSEPAVPVYCGSRLLYTLCKVCGSKSGKTAEAIAKKAEAAPGS